MDEAVKEGKQLKLCSVRCVVDMTDTGHIGWRWLVESLIASYGNPAPVIVHDRRTRRRDLSHVARSGGLDAPPREE